MGLSFFSFGSRFCSCYFCFVCLFVELFFSFVIARLASWLFFSSRRRFFPILVSLSLFCRSCMTCAPRKKKRENKRSRAIFFKTNKKKKRLLCLVRCCKCVYPIADRSKRGKTNENPFLLWKCVTARASSLFPSSGLLPSSECTKGEQNKKEKKRGNESSIPAPQFP